MTARGGIRAARRPQGWKAPGAPPRGAQGEAALVPAEGEDLCLLSGDWRIFQRLRGHRWSLDDLATAWYAARACEAPPRRVLDLGSGIGSILLMTAWRFPEADLVGVEAQEVSAALAERSIRYNGVGRRCRVRRGDLREVAPDGPFDLVTASPPYFVRGTARSARDAQCRACREEERGGLEDYLEIAAPRLEERGRLVLCFAALQRARLERAVAERGLQVLRWREVVGKVGKAPLLMIAALGLGRGEVPPAEPPVAVRGGDGQWTAEFRRLRREMGMPEDPPPPGMRAVPRLGGG